MVTVAICTRNRAGLLEKAALSVLSQLTEESELLIIDNGSTDATPQLCAQLSAENQRVRALREFEPGLSVARNRALNVARGEWVIFLDDDAIAEAGWLAEYETFFQHPAGQKAASVGGPAEPLYEVPAPNWLPNTFPVSVPHSEARLCGTGESLIGCNFAVRREFALAVGGFNPLLGHCGTKPGAYDEIDLNERFNRAGYEIWWLGGARVKHLVDSSRLHVRGQVVSAFRLGNCSAIRRLSQKTSRTYYYYFALLRLLVAPFHCFLHLLAAAGWLLLQNRKKAMRSLFRASSAAGFGYELVKKVVEWKHA